MNDAPPPVSEPIPGEISLRTLLARPLRTAAERATVLTLEFWLVAALLIAIAMVIGFLRLESELGLPRILPIVVVGFVVHAALPRALRPAFFFALSLVTLAALIPFPWFALVVLVGLGLIGLCHLPVRLGVRVGLLGLAALGLAFVRIRPGAGPEALVPLGKLVVPVVAAMFMFRIALYLYDMKRVDPSLPLWRRLSYFFLLPNFAFLLFPIVDYRTYVRTWYEGPDLKIYSKGVQWIGRGTLHLVAYKLVYYNAGLIPADVVGLGTAVEYMVATYLLYMRVSGHYHIIIGILCLFGHDLPETNRNYFLTSNFLEYWHRANIYWKDAMKRVVYFPAQTKLRHLGLPLPASVALSTAVVFVLSWFLHGYQWFWLGARFPLFGTDAIFWGVIGTAVLITAVHDSTRPRRSVKPPGSDLRASMIWGAKVVAMFSFLALLWSMWSTANLRQWVWVMGRAAESPPRDFVVLLLVLAAGVLTLGGLRHLWEGARKSGRPVWRFLLGARAADRPLAGWGGYIAVMTLSIASLGVGRSGLAEAGIGADVLSTIGWTRLNAADMTRRSQTYYEGVIQSPRNVVEAQRGAQERPADWLNLDDTDAIQDVPGLQGYTLVPNWRGRVGAAPFSTNEWGMRDRSYDRRKPDGVRRIAMVGSSNVMGSGVADGASFESLLEESLNEAAESGEEAWEVLNFAIAGHGMVEISEVAVARASLFQPDMLVYPMHPREAERSWMNLHEAVASGTPIGNAFIERTLERSGIGPGTGREEFEIRITPHRDRIVEWSLERMARQARMRGAVPVAVNMTLTAEADGPIDREMRRLLGAAERAGWTVVRLGDPYRGLSEKELQLAPWDLHPTPRAHRAYARSLHEGLAAAGLVPPPPEEEP